MKYIFFYSQLYEYFYNHIHDNIKSFFDLEAIKIDNLTNNSNHTFFGGVSIKIELIIQKIKENMGNSIIFTDATIFINFNNSNKLVEFFNIYTNNDLCFSDNEGGGHKYNIGIILINCNIKTLSFFENVLDDLFCTFKTTRSANKVKIKDCIKGGVEIPGAVLNINYNLQIK